MQIKPIIEANHLSFSRDGVPIVSDFSFSITRGQFVAIIGPNGGGKTTLVKLILGLLRPRSGTLQVNARLAYVPQRGGNMDPQFPATVGEIVHAGLAGRSDSKTAVKDTLETMGIAHLEDRTLAALSGGERQRALIAKALVGKPELLILDEPTDGLDPGTRDALYATLHQLKTKQHVTILCVSHDVHAVVPQADAALCLKHELVCHGEHACYLPKSELSNVFHKGHKDLVDHHAD